MSLNTSSWGDYAGLPGFYGQASSSDVNDLYKALLVGREQNPPGSAVAGDGFALRVESLDPVLKVTTHSMRHIKFWQNMPKKKAYNTNEEFNQLQSYGNVSGGLVFDEGGLPVEVDSTYERKIVPIKLMGIVGRVSHLSTVVKPAHGSAIALETTNKMMHFLRNLSELLYFGDSTLDPGQFDGLERYIRRDAPGNIIDMRGASLTEEAASDGALQIMAAESYGYPTHMWMAPESKADFVKSFFDRGRYPLGNIGSVGGNVETFLSPAGDVALEADIFLSREAMTPVSSVTAEGDSAVRPGTPSITTAATSPVNAASLFIAADVGAYFYYVQAVNRAGASLPVVIGAAVTPAAGDDIRFGVSPGAGPLPRYYKVFRTRVGGATGTARLIAKVVATAGEVTVIDLNESLPGTSKAFMIQQDETNLSFAQLAPMTRFPLAQLDTSIRWAQILYGALMLYTPRHNVMYINIGRSADSVSGPGI